MGILKFFCHPSVGILTQHISRNGDYLYCIKKKITFNLHGPPPLTFGSIQVNISNDSA